jgi:hypothetical protein
MAKKRGRKRKGSTTTKKRSRKSAKKRGGKLPLEVIAKFARKLKKNKRAADVYRSIL